MRNYKQFYALLKQLPGAEKEALALQFTNGRTNSLQAMYTHEYQLLIVTMRAQKFDAWRKRVMAAIGGWLRACGTEHTPDTIKAIACRAARRTDFNSITLSELRAIYAEFNNKQKVAKRCATMN